jgi:hypothetical protein
MICIYVTYKKFKLVILLLDDNHLKILKNKFIIVSNVCI